MIDSSPSVEAKVLFFSDRTCCVCRKRGKSVQIHHIDDNHENNNINNLAVLCLECHTNTQIKGGFFRKLDAEQIILYRDDWQRLVARSRAQEPSKKMESEDLSLSLQIFTTMTEVLRRRNQKVLLAQFYDGIGNKELRDIYVEEVLKRRASDYEILRLRGLQDRPDLIPQDVINRIVAKYIKNKDWTELARLYVTIRDHKKAATYYVKGIDELLKEGNTFSAAFYLKEIVECGLISSLFEHAYDEATAKNELWWQTRALKELGWQPELKNLLVQNKERIKESDDLFLMQDLALALGDTEEYHRLKKQEAESITYSGGIESCEIDPDESDADKQEGDDNSL